MSGHGGNRPGAGRPRKWSFDDVLRVGQACEARWRKAQTDAYEAARQELFSERTELIEVWKKANQIPVQKRGEWRSSSTGQQHSADIEIELEGLHTCDAEKPNPAVAGDAEESDGVADTSETPMRLVKISNKPSKGARTQIITEVAARIGLTPLQVDNLWQAYRRFEREEPPET